MTGLTQLTVVKYSWGNSSLVGYTVYQYEMRIPNDRKAHPNATLYPFYFI